MPALQYMACNPNAFEMLKMKKRPAFTEDPIKSEKRPAKKRAKFVEELRGFIDKIGGVLLQDLAKSGKVHLIPSEWSSILHLLNYSFSIFL